MKILYHHRTQAEDGQAVHIRSLQRALVEAGHELHEVGLVAQGQGDGGGEQHLAAQRSRWAWVGRLPRSLRELAEYAYSSHARGKLLAAGRTFRPDFVYERYAFGNTAGVSAARALGVPLLLEVNSPMVEELGATRGLSFERLARHVEDWIFRSADRALVVTGVLGDMLEGYGVPRERIIVVPNGVDLEAYGQPGDPATRAAARLDLGLSPEARGPVLGFVGYYRTWHRLDLALLALREPGLEDAELVLIGDGPAGEELKSKAQSLGVAARVHFAGRRGHAAIPGLLAAFDVALLPAINPYASPLKLHEYMAAGLATLAPDQANLREVLADGENGRLVTPGDGDAYAAALVELARNPALAARLGAAARRTVEERDLTWRGNARRVIEAARSAGA
ncbi:MAG: glycosyltransferase [Planctomycetaceae bacterium]|nr:glycosyltransferase [Planctomycetaceae bacterium]